VILPGEHRKRDQRQSTRVNMRQLLNAFEREPCLSRWPARPL